MRWGARPLCLLCVGHSSAGALCVRACRVLMCLGWFGCQRARHLWAQGAAGLREARIRRPSCRKAPGNTKQTQQWFSRRLWGLSAGGYAGPLCAFVVAPPPPPGHAGAAHVPVPCLRSTVVRMTRCGLVMDCIGYPQNFSRQISRVAVMRRHARPHCILCVWHNFDGALCMRVCRVLMCLGCLGCEHARRCGR